MKRNLKGILAITCLLLGIGVILLLKTEEKGIYYEPLTKRAALGNPNLGIAQHSYGTLYYNGKIYTSQEQFTYDNSSFEEYMAIFNQLPLDEITDVYGIECYWSTDSSDLYETQNTGKLYKIQGYSDDRICLCYTTKIQQTNDTALFFYNITIFDCLNGIRLTHGEDLYKDILNLKSDNIKEVYAGHFSDNYDVPDEQKTNPVLIAHKEKTFSSFISALYQGDFIAQEDAADLTNNDGEFIKWEFILNNCDSYFLLRDSYGIQTEIYISPQGYVLFFSPEATVFITKVDIQICKQILSKYF